MQTSDAILLWYRSGDDMQFWKNKDVMFSCPFPVRQKNLVSLLCQNNRCGATTIDAGDFTYTYRCTEKISSYTTYTVKKKKYKYFPSLSRFFTVLSIARCRWRYPQRQGSDVALAFEQHTISFIVCGVATVKRALPKSAVFSFCIYRWDFTIYTVRSYLSWS
ncbi:uncharacterized protein LOC116434764 [Nomia melanderi]|uniref:uncharacterized protein LOC116434764 n=1 Tax=Nomia melanderi TaxID=2448451 RepID=UPI003FCDB234